MTMKNNVDMVKANCDGLAGLEGEEVFLLCANYFYAGTLAGVNQEAGCLCLENARIVYETGQWSDAQWKDAQKIGQRLFVQLASIESFCKGKK